MKNSFLKLSMGIEKSKVNSVIDSLGLSLSVRPEQLSMEDFVAFARKLKSVL